MVTHIHDGSYAPDPQPDLADRVADKIQHNLIQDAYNLLKDGVSNKFSGADRDGDGLPDKNRSRDTDYPLVTKEREVYMQSLVAEINQKCPGGLDKLASPWLNDYYRKEIVDGSGKERRPFTLKELGFEASSGAVFDKYMAQASLKEAATIAGLYGDDQRIDKLDLDLGIGRMRLEDRESMAKRLIDKAACDMETNLVGSYQSIKNALKQRHPYEKSSEIAADESAIVAALKNNPQLTARLSMLWLNQNANSMWDNSLDKQGVTLEKIKDHQNPDHVDELLAKYAIDNFGTIAATSLENQRDNVITYDEIPNYVKILKNKK